MPTNVLDDPEQSFLALVNDESSYCLWPRFAPPPAGWRTAYGPDRRESCLEWIEKADQPGADPAAHVPAADHG
jgi:MbtH protein